MMERFNPREVLEVAVEMERQGEAFYQELLKASDNAEVRQVLSHMAREEAGHAQDFQKLLASLKEKVQNYDYPLDEHSLLYFEAFAKTQVFKDVNQAKKAAQGFESFADAVHFAIGLEVKTIAFYSELLKAMGKVPGAEKIEELINQEREHVAELYGLLEC